ncbi:hypothetical protein D3C71_1603420 [compost metagenome]
MQAVVGAGASNHLGRVGVDHVAQGIAGNEGPHSHTVHRDRRRADAAFHGPLNAKNLAQGSASACSHVALGRVGGGCGVARRVACRGIGAYAHVAHQQVEQHGRRHDGQAPHGHIKTHATLFEPAHGAGGGVQPPGTSAGQHDGVHLVHQVGGVEQVRLARARSGAAHIHACHRAFAGDDDGAAGGAAGFGEVAHLNARHAGDAASVAGQNVLGTHGR